MKRSTPLFTSLIVLCLTGLSACTQMPVECHSAEPLSLSSVPMPGDVWQRLEEAPRSNPVREQTVLEYFSGCRQLSTQSVSRNQNNMICRIPGKSEQTLVLGAHHDRLGPNNGIADNWTGIVLAAAMIARLQSEMPRHTWMIVAFADEESGMNGSRLFVDRFAEPVVGYINVDTVGTGKLSFDTRSSAELLCLGNQVATELNLEAVNTRISNSVSDWVSFDKKHVDFLAVHSLDRRQTLKLHTRRDNLNLVDKTRLEQAWQFLHNFILNLDRR